MQEQEDPELTSFTLKFQLFTEQLLMTKTLIQQKGSSTTKDVKKEPQLRQVGGMELWNSQDPYLQVGDPQM